MKSCIIIIILFFILIIINKNKKIENFYTIKENKIIWRNYWLNNFYLTDNNKIIFVNNKNLGSFLEKKINRNYVLISDFEDYCIPFDPRNKKFTKEYFNKIYNNKFLIKWYSINYNYNKKYKKITNLPLGIDFHTIAKSKKWGQNKENSISQENKLIEKYNLSKKIKERKNKCFLCGNNNTSKSLKNIEIVKLDRDDIKNKLKNNKNVDICSKFYDRNNFWNKLCEYKFIICPVGNGMDTHRLWESLFLGCIVIVQSCGLNKLMKEFPVVILDNFNEITEENLNKWYIKYKDMCDNPIIREKYFNKYWYKKMLNHF